MRDGIVCLVCSLFLLYLLGGIAASEDKRRRGLLPNEIRLDVFQPFPLSGISILNGSLEFSVGHVFVGIRAININGVDPIEPVYISTNGTLISGVSEWILTFVYGNGTYNYTHPVDNFQTTFDVLGTNPNNAFRMTEVTTYDTLLQLKCIVYSRPSNPPAVVSMNIQQTTKSDIIIPFSDFQDVNWQEVAGIVFEISDLDPPGKFDLYGLDIIAIQALPDVVITAVPEKQTAESTRFKIVFTLENVGNVVVTDMSAGVTLPGKGVTLRSVSGEFETIGKALWKFPPVQPGESKSFTAIFSADLEGIYEFSLIGDASSLADFAVQVTPAIDDPAANVTVPPKEQFSLKFPDQSNGTYLYSATQADKTSLPPFLYFDSDLLELSGVLPEDQAEDIHILVRGVDENGDAQVSFSFSILVEKDGDGENNTGLIVGLTLGLIFCAALLAIIAIIVGTAVVILKKKAKLAKLEEAAQGA
eukprot:TRINITY_DN8555_c0_g1_i1.p1 TRINITY_DN8555_c0_g1~~TRINITY_DN8555_c0_g1_i1.p1  ORF type:complete len:473 (-),score=63.16 TRINITY_DN8555_c0_g1_i1:95-1513(-)